MYQYILLAPS